VLQLAAALFAVELSSSNSSGQPSIFHSLGHHAYRARAKNVIHVTYRSTDHQFPIPLAIIDLVILLLDELDAVLWYTFLEAGEHMLLKAWKMLRFPSACS
jgi:hypothetical protein